MRSSSSRHLQNYRLANSRHRLQESPTIEINFSVGSTKKPAVARWPKVLRGLASGGIRDNKVITTGRALVESSHLALLSMEDVTACFYQNDSCTYDYEGCDSHDEDICRYFSSLHNFLMECIIYHPDKHEILQSLIDNATHGGNGVNPAIQLSKMQGARAQIKLLTKSFRPPWYPDELKHYLHEEDF